ncbi:MAG: hypothetical protein WC848_00540 [Parcubacteria group bacterium]|jgi:hypothetical protein
MKSKLLNSKLIFLSLLIFCGLFSFGAKASAATVYIDPTCGSSGNGTTITCGASGPFKTWAEVSWVAGNTYSQKGGTTYYGTVTVGASGTEGNPIIINSYGTGKAILDGSVTITEWTANDPVAGVYSTTAVTNNAIYEDDVPLRYGRDTECNYGNVYWESGWKNYYKPTSGIPADHIIQYTRLYGINLGSHSYITIDGLSFRRYGNGVYTANIAGSHNDYILVTNSDFDDIIQGVQIFTNNAISTGISITDNNFSYVQNSIELGTANTATQGDAGAFMGATIASNAITHCSQAKNTPYIWRTYGNDYDIDFAYTYWGWSGGTDTEGIGTQALNNSSVYENNITGMCRGFVHYVGSCHDGSNNNIYRNYINTLQNTIQLAPEQLASSFYNNKIYYNILYGGNSDGWTSNLSIFPIATPGGENYIYNNTIITDSRIGIYSIGQLDSYIIENNIVVSDNLPNLNWLVYLGSVSNSVINYNLYFPASNVNRGTSEWAIEDDGGSKTFLQWNTLGYDANSSVSDPLLFNFSGGDYNLTAPSPAKWTGIDVGLATDYLGQSINNPPSIGAYEYHGSDAIPPNMPSGLAVE